MKKKYFGGSFSFIFNGASKKPKALVRALSQEIQLFASLSKGLGRPILNSSPRIFSYLLMTFQAPCQLEIQSRDHLLLPHLRTSQGRATAYLRASKVHPSHKSQVPENDKRP